MFPRLIFFEQHDDPTCGRILAKLLPKLKELGYDCFYDEVPPSIKPQDFLKNTRRILKNESTDPLMKEIIEHQFQYQGIDVDLEKQTQYLDVGCFVGYEREFNEVLLSFRDKYLSSAYMGASGNIIGHNGIGHANGIQRNILENFSKDEAEDNFSFFGLRQSGAKYCEWKEDLNTPIPLTILDAKEKTDDEISEIILKEILEKSKKLKTHKKTVEVKPDVVSDQEVKQAISIAFQKRKGATGCNEHGFRIYGSFREEVIEAFIMEAKTGRDAKINQARLQLLNYFDAQENRIGTSREEYYTFFGRLKGMSCSIKKSATRKMIDLLNGKKIKPFLEKELEALRECTLGGIISKMESDNILPLQFARADNAIRLREFRMLR